jgi:mono/diheme cytochrome c family protein
LLGFALVVGAGLALRAKWLVERSYAHVSMPPIVADTSPAGVARGEMLVESLCLSCHRGADGRATGQRLGDLPAFLGTFYAANLAHPEHGVRQLSDGQIARVLRTGVLPNGQLSPLMNGFQKLGDTDVAAILGYIRSGAKAFEPAGTDQPRSQPSLVGEIIFTYVRKFEVDAPATGVQVPDKSDQVAYGRYMAGAMDCASCHTAGFGPDKLNDPGAFAGGFALTDPSGRAIFTRNITFDEETGIGRWSLDDFERAVRSRVRPDGHLLRKPMPQFAQLGRDDIAAIYAFLKTVPKVHRPNEPGGSPPHKAKPDAAPEALFVDLGCAGCHGDQAPHRDRIRSAIDKPDADVASWILDPQALKPGAAMPSFHGAIDRRQAERLAKYLKQLAKKRG